VDRDPAGCAAASDVHCRDADLGDGLEDLVSVQAPSHPAFEPGAGRHEALEVTPGQPGVAECGHKGVDGQLQLRLVGELAPGVRPDAEHVYGSHATSPPLGGLYL
jgi:hypothetical protein